MVIPSLIDRPPYFFIGIWCLYILLAPFYVFEQGAAQPSSYLALIGIIPAIAIATLRANGKISPVVLYGSLFAMLAFCVNAIHYLFLPDMRFVFSAVYYLFNVALFFYAVLLFRMSPDHMGKATYLSLAASLIIQCVFVAAAHTVDAGRALGTFNNPNQLAYWALLTMIMLVIVKRPASLNLFDICLIAAGLYLQAAALSKAGLITSALFVLSLYILPSLKAGGRWAISGLLCIAMVFIMFDSASMKNALSQHDIPSSIIDRLQTLGAERDDSAEGRGYDRILDHPAYLFFGAGEGGFERFGGPVQELHSGLATLVFSYGMVGLILFISLLWSVFYSLPRRFVVWLGIVLLFGVAHQSLRTPHFWLFLGVCYGSRYLYLAHHEGRVGTAKAERVG